jgi:hypothetical protein
MERKIESLWYRLKTLPWYGKATIGGFFLLAIVALYALVIFRRGSGVSDFDLVKRSKWKTDHQVEEFKSEEVRRDAKRQELKEKRSEIKKKMEKYNGDHGQIMQAIDDASTADDLNSIADRLRKRNRRGSRRDS